MDAGHLTETKRVPHHKYVERETTMKISEFNIIGVKDILKELKQYLFGRRCKCKNKETKR
jgi:hypothetical protein